MRRKRKALLQRPACCLFDTTCLNWNLRQWHQPAVPCWAFKNTVAERKKPQGGIISPIETTGGWNGSGWVIFHLPAWLARNRDLKRNDSIVPEQGNEVGTEVVGKAAHQCIPHMSRQELRFPVTLIAWERVHVFCFSGLDRLASSHHREKKVSGFALRLRWGRYGPGDTTKFLGYVLSDTWQDEIFLLCSDIVIGLFRKKYVHKLSWNCAKL